MPKIYVRKPIVTHCGCTNRYHWVLRDGKRAIVIADIFAPTLGEALHKARMYLKGCVNHD